MCPRRTPATLPHVTTTDPTAEDHQRLTTMYDAYAHRVYGYALRHCGANDADDVLSETFATAWRRIDVVPDAELPWLLVTARHLIANRRRATIRGDDVVSRLAGLPDQHADAPDALVLERHQLIAALAQLTEREREALLLVAWDGLDTNGAAQVAHCSPRAFKARLARARVRLTAALAEHPDPAPRSLGPVPLPAPAQPKGTSR